MKFSYEETATIIHFFSAFVVGNWPYVVKLAVGSIEFYNTNFTDAIDYKTYAKMARLDNRWFILCNDEAKLNNKIAKWNIAEAKLVNEVAKLDVELARLDVEEVRLYDAAPGTDNKLYMYSLYWFVWALTTVIFLILRRYLVLKPYTPYRINISNGFIYIIDVFITASAIHNDFLTAILCIYIYDISFIVINL